MQQNNEYHAGLAWAQGLQRSLLGNEGPLALAVLLTAGWSALATLVRDGEESTSLGQDLRESMARVREEFMRPVEIIDSLLDLARQLLLSDRLAQALPASFAQVPPRLHPNLGPLQKERASLDALQQALSDYQAAAVRYAQELSKLFEAALSEYQQELSAGVPPKPTPQLLTRELHDRWIQIAERTYERFLGSAEHTRVIGGLMNTWADLQLALRPVVDEVLLHMGLPNRRAVDDVQMHLDRLRRQQRADSMRLQREITALRDELAAWRGDPPGPARRPRFSRDNRS